MRLQNIGLLLRKDLLRRRRAPLAVIALLVFPLMLTGLIALAFGRGESPLPAAKLLIEDNDKGLASQVVNALFDAEELRPYVEASPAGKDGRQRLADGEVSALMILPEHLTERILAGEKVELRMLRNPAQTILPQIAEEIGRTVADVLAIGAEVLRSQKGELGLEGGLASFESLDAAGYGRFGMVAQRLGQTIGPYLDHENPLIEIERVELDAAGDPKPAEKDNEQKDDGPSTRTLIFLMVLPGMMVYALFAIGEQMMRDLLFEAGHGTLRRQLCAPISVAELIAAKVLVAATVAGAALIVMMGLAVALIQKPIDPLGFATLSLCLVLAVCGASATIYGFARTERQGSAIASMIFLLCAFLGGSFLPLDSLPAAARRVAPLSPFYWGTRGFQDLLAGSGLQDILPSIGILLALGALLLFLGSYLLDRCFRRGGLS